VIVIMDEVTVAYSTSRQHIEARCCSAIDADVQPILDVFMGTAVPYARTGAL